MSLILRSGLATLALSFAATAAEQTPAPEPLNVEWKPIALQDKRARVAKTEAMEARGIRFQKAPKMPPLVAEVQADGSIVIRHQRPQPKTPVEASGGAPK